MHGGELVAHVAGIESVDAVLVIDQFEVHDEKSAMAG
jgi:hypothetical protein